MEFCQANWYFKKTDFLSHSPSRYDGISVTDEKKLRSKGIKYIVQVCVNIKLPQIVIATASVYFHRFFMRKSFREFHPYDVGGACVLLAVKVEEPKPRRTLCDVASACARVARRDKSLDDKKEIEMWVDTLKHLEPLIAAILCFDLQVDHPYLPLLKYTKELKGYNKEVLRDLASAAWAIINHSHQTPICLFYQPTTIASAAVFIASKVGDVSLNDDATEGTVWWNVMQSNIYDTTKCIDDILDMYTATCPKLNTSSEETKINPLANATILMNSCENNAAIMSGSTTPIIDPIFNEYEYINVDQIYEPPLENPSPSSHTIDNDEDEFEELENGDDTVIEVECEGAAHYINSVPKETEHLQDGQYGDRDSQYGGYEEDDEDMEFSDETQFSDSQHTVPSEEGEEYPESQYEDNGVDSQHYESQNEDGVLSQRDGSQYEDGIYSQHDGSRSEDAAYLRHERPHYENGTNSHPDGLQYVNSQYDEQGEIYAQNGNGFHNNIQLNNHQGEEEDDVSTIGDELEEYTIEDVEMRDINGIDGCLN
ncbi:cyclin-like protein [Glomus cerebriforme]|uniref:Cyclin-like protein n=1 Tax=Glomus cerebriforme TaxID=658196 RepID=A0A397S7E8_9GLOM|nr:cyclin-like protein [Glomus cerebriforme]